VTITNPIPVEQLTGRHRALIFNLTVIRVRPELEDVCDERGRLVQRQTGRKFVGAEVEKIRFSDISYFTSRPSARILYAIEGEEPKPFYKWPQPVVVLVDGSVLELDMTWWNLIKMLRNVAEKKGLYDACEWTASKDPETNDGDLLAFYDWRDEIDKGAAIREKVLAEARAAVKRASVSLAAKNKKRAQGGEQPIPSINGDLYGA
jgi:hypothetical protein